MTKDTHTDDTHLDYYIQKFLTEFGPSVGGSVDALVFSKELEHLIAKAKMYGAAREKYRLLDMVRHKHIGVAVEAFKKDNTEVMRIVGQRLADELERS